MADCGKLICLLILAKNCGRFGVSVNRVPAKLDKEFVDEFYDIFDIGTRAEGAGGKTNIDVDLKTLESSPFIHKNIDADSTKADVIVSRQSSAKIATFNNVGIIGHRGCGKNEYSPEVLENTVDSFLKAKERGASAIELDVHLTSDGVPVVYHSDDINDTLIGDMKFQEFLRLVHNESQKPSLPASLETVLDALPVDLGVNIELKNHTGEHFLMTKNDYLLRLAVATMKCVEKYPDRKFMFSSFSPAVCLYLKMLNTESNVFYLVFDEMPEHGLGTFNQQLQFARDTGINGFCLSTDIVEKSATLREVVSNGEFPFYCWGASANDRTRAQTLANMGIRAFITDDIDAIQHVVFSSN